MTRDNFNGTDRKPVSISDRPHPRPMNSARFDQHVTAAPARKDSGAPAGKPAYHPRGCCGS